MKGMEGNSENVGQVTSTSLRSETARRVMMKRRKSQNVSKWKWEKGKIGEGLKVGEMQCKFSRDWEDQLLTRQSFCDVIWDEVVERFLIVLCG